MNIPSISRRMMTLAAISSALLPAAAAAQGRSQFPVTASTGSQKQSSPAETKVCRMENQAGSRLSKKTCRTAKEWALEQRARDARVFDLPQRN